MIVKNRIHTLSPQLINQIAAGEVIERPSSVVKELVENSLDAGATRIEVNIELGGKQLIQIRDNGHGILKDDLSLAIGSHATSKIQNFSDLEKIASLGFRGEALASISSISRFSIASKAEGQETSWIIKLAGRADEAVIQPCAHPVGTTITVRDLFFNTPARRKFMRTDKTEMLHIEEVIKRIALSRFNVDFILQHNDKVILNVKAANNEAQIKKRIAKIFGSNFIDHAFEVDEERVGLRLWGWLGMPDFHRSQNDLQYFYLNGRMVKDRLISHAIRQAYQDSVFEGRHPAFCLHLECDPHDVDVNVHPTKHEVRFQQARLVHDFIVQSCQAKILGHVPAPSQLEAPRHYAPSSSALEQTKAYYHVNKVNESGEVDKPFGTVLGQVKPHYALINFEEVLYIIDCLSAQKNTLKKILHTESIPSQPLLIPDTFHLPEQTVQALEKQQPILTQLGIELSIVGPEQVMVRQIPSCLRDFYHKEMLSAVLANVVYHDDIHYMIDVMVGAIDLPDGGLSRTQLDNLMHQIAEEDDWPYAPFCKRVDCEQLFL